MARPPPSQGCPLRGIGGFALLEVLAAVLLLVIGISAAMWSLSRGIISSRDAEMMDQGVALVQEEIERLRAGSFAGTVSSARAAVAGWAGYDRQVIVSPIFDVNMKQVTVRVYWTLGEGGETSTQAATFFVNNDYLY